MDREDMPSEKVRARYRVVRLIGQGAMGVVYEAIQNALNRRVALKMLRPHVFEDAEARRRFVQEGRLLARLSHQNLVTVFDAEIDGERPYLAMEFIDGISLEELIRERKRLSVREVVSISRGILSGLAELHENKVVHRDLKPPNVLMEGRRKPRIVDFGLARHIESGRLTADGFILGTPTYMAPEQLMGRQIEPSADIFAFGVMAFYMLTGTYPYSAPTPEKLLIQKLSTMPSELADRLPEVPQPMVELVVRCLASDASDRPAVGAQALAQLERSTAPRVPTRTTGPNPAVLLKAPAPARANRLPLLAAAGLVVIGLGVALLRPAPAPPAVIVPGPVVDRPDSKAELFARIEADSVRFIRDAASVHEQLAALGAELEPIGDKMHPDQISNRFIELVKKVTEPAGRMLTGHFYTNEAGCRSSPLGPEVVLALETVLVFSREQASRCLEQRVIMDMPHLSDLGGSRGEARAMFRYDDLLGAEAKRLCAGLPGDLGESAGPRWTAATMLLLSRTRFDKKGEELRELEKRVLALAKKALTALAAPSRNPLRITDPALVEAVVHGLEVVGARRSGQPAVDEAAKALATLAEEGPLDPMRTLMFFHLENERIAFSAPLNDLDPEFKAGREKAMIRWSNLLLWLVQTWPWDPRSDPPAGADFAYRDQAAAMARDAVRQCRAQIAMMSESCGKPPPAEPPARK